MLHNGILPAFFQAAVAVMAFLNSSSSDRPHDEIMFYPEGQSSAGKYEVCTRCHWCPAVKTESESPAWEVADSPTRGPYAMTGNVSLMCLSCHDGAMASSPPTSRGWLTGVSTRGLPPKDWSDDLEVGHHPYQVDYPVDGNLFFLPLGGNPDCPLPLFSDAPGLPKVSVECATCHDIHAHGNGLSLRVPMERFELCLCCHGEMPGLNRKVYLPMQVTQSAIDSVDCTTCHDH